jgi:hypothetical protein
MSGEVPGGGEIVVQVNDVRHLFVAPEIDPLAGNEGEVMGEPALLRVVRRLMASRRMREVHKLVVLLPPEKIEPGLEERVRTAVTRYCSLKIQGNDELLRVMRREAGALLLRGIVILMVCMGLSSLFAREAFTVVPELLNSTLSEGFNVIGWVMMWRPVEAFFFNPLPIRTSTAAHRFVQTLHIELRPDRGDRSADGG